MEGSELGSKVTKWWWVPILVGGLWLWHESPRDEGLKSSTAPQPSKIQRSSAPAASGSNSEPPTAQVVQQPAITFQKTKAAPSDRPSPLPAGQIQFDVKENGVAIGFGDVVLGKVLGGQDLKSGVAVAQRTRLWDSAQIPFSIQPGVTNLQAIREAMDEIQKTTPMQFVPFEGQADSVAFVLGSEICASYVGRVGGAQPIFLAPKCGKHEILHELMHALGFVHEHSRVDRDRYVEVLWQNIDPQYWLQFNIVPDEYFHDYSGSVFEFDGESIMLYDQKAFAKNPDLESLRAKPGVNLNPSRGTLSRTDRERVFYLYGH